MRKLKTGYTDYDASQLAQLGGQVGPKVAAMPIFAGVIPSPAIIAADVANLRAKMIGAGLGAAVALHSAMRTLAGSLSLLATNLMEVPNVTESDLAATGFPWVKERVRTTQPPPAPLDLTLRHGVLQGEILAACKIAAKNIRMFEVEWAFDPVNGPWTQAEGGTNSRALPLSGLPRGKDIWVRVRARNVKGLGAWSDPATIMVI